MLEKVQGLEKNAKIRLIVFAFILIWCIFLGVSYANDFNAGNLSPNYLNVSDIDDIYVDGSDFTWAVRLMGYGVNGLMGFVFFLLMIICMIVEAVLTIIPMFLIRFIGVKKTTVITEDEYYLTKYMYFIAIGISIVLGLICSKFIGIVIVLLFTAVWSVIALIYVLKLWERIKYQQNVTIMSSEWSSPE